MIGIRRRLPNSSKSTGRLDNKSCASGVVVVEHFRFELRICRLNQFPSMSFRTGSLWFVLTVLMMLFGHRRLTKLACCTCVPFDDVVVLSRCFNNFAQSSVCLFRGLLRCLTCAFVLGLLRTDGRAFLFDEISLRHRGRFWSCSFLGAFRCDQCYVM